MNIVIKEFNNYVLRAAKECIPKGARKEYKPFWSADLNNKHNGLTAVENLAGVAPSIENNTALGQINAEFVKTRGEARGGGWMRKLLASTWKHMVTTNDNSLQVVELSGLQTCKLLSTHPFKPFPRRFSGPESVCSG